MKRRELMRGVAIAALFTTPVSGLIDTAEARLGGIGGGVPPPGSTLAPAFFPTTNINGGDYVFLSARWTGTAPTSIVSATWSGSGGSGSVLAGSFAVTGGTVQFAISTPSPGSTTSYNLSVIANNGAGTTFTGMSVLAPVVDFAPGIYGPATITYDQGQGAGFNYGGPIIWPAIGSFFTRGLSGPLSATLTDHVFGSGDASQFGMTTKGNGYPPGHTNGFNLCLIASDAAGNAITYSKSQYVIDLNVSNGISTLTMTITMNRPPAPGVWMTATNTLLGGDEFIEFYNSQYTLDTAVPPTSSTTVTVAQLTPSSGTITFTPDSGSLLSFDSGQSLVTIAKSSIAANYGHITFKAQTTAGLLQTFDVWLGHCNAPAVAWQPNGSIYSSTPATTGFHGSNLIGTIAAFSDEHGIIENSSLFRYEILSDSSGVLQVWNDGSVYLSAPVPVGTIDAQIRITTASMMLQLITLSLPVLAGTTLASSNITFTSAGALTNFVPYANNLAGRGHTYNTPTAVGTFTVSGFTPDWTKLQTSMPLGNTFDNAQVFGGGDPSSTAGLSGYNIPRYIVTGSGTSGTITATNLNATNHLTPQVDTLRIQLTDGNGTYCTKDIPLTISWHTGPSITVGPGGTFSSPNTMMQAMWADFIANGAASTYAGAIVTPLPGCAVTTTLVGGIAGSTLTVTSIVDGTPLAIGEMLVYGGFYTFITALGSGAGGTGTYTVGGGNFGTTAPGTTIFASDWNYGQGGGSSLFSGGWLPYPIALIADTSTQWSGNGTISGTTLTINSTSSGTVKAGDYLTSGVGGSKVTIMSGSGSTWTVHVGPDQVSATLSVGPTSMTTKTPRFLFDTQRAVTGGSLQGALVRGGGYDLVVIGFEFANVTGMYGLPPGPNLTSGDSNKGAIYLVANTTGNLWVENCYFHECDVGILNGGPGCQITVNNCLAAKCGNAAGSQHNFYFDTVAKLTFTNNISNDVLVGHLFKTRAMQSVVSGNVFAEGPNGQGSCPINYTFGGAAAFTNNIVCKTMNDWPSFNSIFHQFYDEMNGGQGVVGFSYAWTWPYQNNTVDGCTYFNLIPRTPPFPPFVIYTSIGTRINQPVPSPGFPADPIRNTPLDAVVTNSQFGNLHYTSDEWVSVSYGGITPTHGSGNSAVTNFPASAIRLVDPVVGTPPYRMPNPGPWGYFGVGRAHAQSSIGSSPGTYYMSTTVPSGSPSGTNVTGGALTAYDANFAPLTGPTYTFNNDYTTDNALFSFTTVGSGIQLKTASALADGLYLVTIQCVGTGWDTSTTGSITTISSFRVIVGTYV